MDYNIDIQEMGRKGNLKMKKYLSSIILIIACIICAAVFYVNAKTPDAEEAGTESSSVETSQTESSSTNEGSNSDTARVVTISDKGTIYGEYLCSTRLRVEWSTCKYENDSTLYINAELYLDSELGVSDACEGTFTINGETSEFTLNKSTEKSSLACASSVAVSDFADGDTITISGYIGLSATGEGGVSLSSLSVSGKIYQSETNVAKDSVLLNVEHISQFPELPSGDEITSLAIVLRYLKYNVNACDLCDLYLDKGPVGFTDFFKANAGNPRDTYNSYGCLAPVIVNSAKKYISVSGGSHTAYDYSGYNAKELLRQVSEGSPVIVWLCDDFGNTPSISRVWIVDGKTLYVKSNMACMVLIGYDYTKNTVTLANPAGNIFTIEMDKFEQSYADMGSYAVVVK